MAYFIIAVLLWFVSGLVIALLFLEPAITWLRNYNRKYAEKLSYYFRKDEKPMDVAVLYRYILAFEIAAFLLGMLISFNAIFGMWAFGFSLYAVSYFAKLLHMRELEKFDNQMIDITYAMKNSLKAGMTLQQAMSMISTEFSNPAAEQFRIALREMQLGASIEEALNHLEERMPNADLKIMVNAIEILRQTGGNMVETMETLTETLKNRKRVEGKIKTLTAQGRMQAIILCVMPFAMALILYFMSPDYIRPLFNTILGWIILTIVILLVSVGWIIIQKVISIEV